MFVRKFGKIIFVKRHNTKQVEDIAFKYWQENDDAYEIKRHIVQQWFQVENLPGVNDGNTTENARNNIHKRSIPQLSKFIRMFILSEYPEITNPMTYYDANQWNLNIIKGMTKNIFKPINIITGDVKKSNSCIKEQY